MSKEAKIAKEKKQQEAKRIMNEEHFIKCNAIIHTAAAAAGVAGAIPIPMADAIPISTAQITMAMGLGKVFDQSVTEAAAKSLITAATSTIVGRTAVKFIPIVGWGISAAVAITVTEAVGWSLAVDFAKSAKKKYDEKYETFCDGIPQSQNVTEEGMKNLEKICDEFLNGEKNPSENKSDYDNLMNDIENVLDDIPVDSKLRQKYDQLCLLGI